MAMAINSAVAVALCSLVVVLVVGGCSGAALPEGSTETSVSPSKETDMPVVPYVAASMEKVPCQTKDACAEALNSTIDRVECVDGMCGCLYNHVFARGTCLRKKGLLQNCSSSLQCEQQDAACVDGACECKEGYVINPAQDRCLQVASKMKDICVEDIQCIGKLSDSSYCKNNMCVCKVGTIEAGGVCAVPRGLGDPCSAPGDCLAGMVCNSGACACEQGRQPSDDKTRCIGNGASSTMASLVVLCLGLLSTSQLRRYA